MENLKRSSYWPVTVDSLPQLVMLKDAFQEVIEKCQDLTLIGHSENKMLYNLSCLETRFRLLHRRLNLALTQRKLHNVFIFGMACHKPLLETKESSICFKQRLRNHIVLAKRILGR